MDEVGWESAVPNLAGQLAPIDFRRGLRGGGSQGTLPSRKSTVNEAGTGLTTTTAHTGTERYLAPELIDSETCRPTCESDFIFLVNPYQHRRSNLRGRIIRDILNGDPPATFHEEMDPNYESLSIILQRFWHQIPSKRPDMTQFLSWLELVGIVGCADDHVRPLEQSESHMGMTVSKSREQKREDKCCKALVPSSRLPLSILWVATLKGDS
ncbi:9857_t:CDS:2, partial [Acaulospora colombiana]